MNLKKKRNFILAAIATASFFEEERREKDKVKSATGFRKKRNLRAPPKKSHFDWEVADM